MSRFLKSYDVMHAFYHTVRERLVRLYLIVFCLAALLAELDTPVARDNFRALQKWWFKVPFYVL
jgi:hypothetical protein